MVELTDKNIKNFWKKVDKKGEDECWEWVASKNNHGYGQFKINKKPYLSHRISWILSNGQIPQDDSYFKTLHILHSCDNPGCQNPNHLFLGTQKDNMEDMINKNRQSINRQTRNQGEKCGAHKLTEEQVLKIRQKYSTCLYTQKQLADEYGVGQDQISRIVNNKTWKHI